MRVAVVDDEGNFAKKVKKDIEEFFVGQKETVKVKYFSDDSILADLQNQKYYDLYLLDVEMPEINGIILVDGMEEVIHLLEKIRMVEQEGELPMLERKKLLLPLFGRKQNL